MNIEHHDLRKVWLVEHPISQYNENVKLLARQHNLKIFDPKYIDVGPEFLAENPPELTKRESPQKSDSTKAKPKLVARNPK